MNKMANEPEEISKLIRLNPEAKRRILELEKDIPALEKQIEGLSELMDVSSLREKLDWGKKAAKVLKEHFT